MKTPHVKFVTRHSIRNYGSVLQTFATQTLFRQLGATSEVLDYRQPGVTDTASGYRQKGLGIAGAAKHVAYKLYRGHGARARGQLFESFLREQIDLSTRRYSSLEELSRFHQDQADNTVFCVGSDQVWNIEYNLNNAPYYLEFAPRVARKFSFSSSIGMRELPKGEEERLRQALSEFQGVSVRETGAQDYLQSLGIDAVEHVDPVLALDKQEWSSFASNVPVSSRPFILVYQLNQNAELQQASLALSRELNLPVVRIEYWQTLRGRGAETVMRPSVEQFVALFRDAAFVVTDSFHGSAFSLNFGKPFVSVLPPNYSGRITSLLSKFGIGERTVKSASEAWSIAEEQVGWTGAEDLLVSERQRVRKYLQRNLASGDAKGATHLSRQAEQHESADGTKN